MERVSKQVPPWWACAWAKEHTPGLRRRSSRCIVSVTRRTGWRGGASAPVTPARPPPECPGAHSRSWSKPPTSDALAKEPDGSLLFHGKTSGESGTIFQKRQTYLLDLPWTLASLQAANEPTGGMGVGDKDGVKNNNCEKMFTVCEILQIYRLVYNLCCTWRHQRPLMNTAHLTWQVRCEKFSRAQG